MKLLTFAGILVACVFIACNDGSTTYLPAGPSPPAGSQPQPSGNQDLGCTARGDELVKSFFEALNQGDSPTLKSMFLSGTPVEFSFVPDIIAAAETSISTADEAHRSSQAFTLDEVEGVVSNASGLKFELSTAIRGGTYADTNPETVGRLMYGFSPVLWKATGPPLESRGRAAVSGGGKIAIDCETGLLQKVLLSPLSFE